MSVLNDRIQRSFDDHIQVMTDLRSCAVVPLTGLIVAAVSSLKAGGKILLFGNGGSASDAQHIAAELVGRFVRERGALAALALTTDTSALTSIANDYGYDYIFDRQVAGLAGPDDLVIGLSTSGNSANVVRGIEQAAGLGCTTAAFTGRNGGALGTMVDHHLNVPHGDTARIQEAHITLGHILCDCVETVLAEGATP